MIYFLSSCGLRVNTKKHKLCQSGQMWINVPDLGNYAGPFELI
jgi:hypothetical protein